MSKKYKMGCYNGRTKLTIDTDCNGKLENTCVCTVQYTTTIHGICMCICRRCDHLLFHQFVCFPVLCVPINYGSFNLNRWYFLSRIRVSPLSGLYTLAWLSRKYPISRSKASSSFLVYCVYAAFYVKTELIYTMKMSHFPSLLQREKRWTTISCSLSLPNYYPSWKIASSSFSKAIIKREREWFSFVVARLMVMWRESSWSLLRSMMAMASLFPFLSLSPVCHGDKDY